jgi:outer membrane autotransporter protein
MNAPRRPRTKPNFAGPTTYTGGTNVAAGTLAVGDALHPDAALSGGGATGVANAATLGGHGSVTGNVTNAGTIAVADALPAFAGTGPGAFTINGNLTNAGVASVGGAGVGNRLNVIGNYAGQNGTLALNTTLAGDNAASDRLVISGVGSTATGTSAIKINNVGGAGAATLTNGIQVIEANGGATTDLSAFRLAAPVKAGAYSYYLAKGGVTDGTSQNWYLRNTIPAAAAPATTAPPGASSAPSVTPSSAPGAPSSAPVASGAPVALPANPSQPVSDQNPLVAPNTPIAAPGTPRALAAAVGNPPSVVTPIYRPEAPIYAAIPMVARQIGIQQIDTFHDRQGEQSLLDETGSLPAAWGRVWGGHTVQSQDGTLNPEFDGSIYGLQAGHDIYADSRPSGHRNHYGFFVGFTRATGDVNGYALATPNLDVGHLAINGYSLGAYWTHIGPGGWYTDAVLMGTSLTIDPQSNDGTGATTHGRAVSGSVEAGLPIPIAYGLSLEPQAQIVWQNLSINDLNDGVSTVSFRHGNTFLGRLGVRLSTRFAALQPYLRLSVLRNFGAGDEVTFGGTTTLPGSVGQTAGQIGAGLVAQISKSSSAYATVAYLTNFGGTHQRTVTGNAGLRWSW